MKPQSRSALRGVLALGALLCVAAPATPGRAQALRKVAGPRLAQAVGGVDWKLLPPKTSKPEVERAQAVETTGRAPLVLLPVRYEVELPGGDRDPTMPPATHFACGIVTVSGSGVQHFIATLGMPGSAREIEECTALRAVGAAEVNRPDGALILIYQVYVLHAPPAEYFDEAVLLARDAQGDFHVDEAGTAALSTDVQGSPTVLNVRKALRGKASMRP